MNALLIYLLKKKKSSGQNECDDDTQCTDNRICIVGKCKCKSGYVERDGVCIQIEGRYKSGEIVFFFFLIKAQKFKFFCNCFKQRNSTRR